MERTHISVWQVVAGVTPLFWTLIAAAGAIGIGEILLWAIAARRLRRAADATSDAPGDAGRRRREAGWLALAAVAGPVLLTGLIVVSIRIGHANLARGLAASAPAEAIALIRSGLDGFLTAKPLGLMLLGPVVVLATVAASLHASAALQLPTRPCVIVSLIFVGAGLGPFLVGALAYSSQLTHILASSAGTDPAFKEMMITQGIAETRALLDRGALLGAAGFGAALIVAIVVAVAGDIPIRPRRGGWWAPAVCLIAAAGLFAAAQPLRAENTAPWPASPCAALTINRVATPDIDGPDAIPRAEVVTVSDTLLLVDGGPRIPVEMRDALVTMRNNYNLIHPSELLDESLVIVCPPETKAPALIEVLQVAKALEYRRPAFAFGKETFIERPLLGRLRRWQWTAAKALIPGVGPETPTPIVTLPVGDYQNCDAVARAVAAIRRSGKIAGLAF